MGSIKKMKPSEKKAKKITKDELENLQNAVSVRRNIYNHIADLEVKKYDALKALDKADGALNNQQNNLKEKYGDISIDVTDGSIKEIEDAKSDTKN